VSCALERFLLRRGQTVVRVPPKLMAGQRKAARTWQERSDRRARGRPRGDPRLARESVDLSSSSGSVQTYGRMDDMDASDDLVGGLVFLLNGNMAVGLSGAQLMVRVGPEASDDALERPHTRPFDMTGRPMKGWVLVAPEGIAAERDLATWVAQGVEFARSLPSKG
jgi:hypothetical protein